MEISVVIPTRNRFQNVKKLLQNLLMQTLLPAEVIIVDSSDDMPEVGQLQKDYPALNISLISSIPSVCIQRNLGIKKAKGNWIFLCDDDIELPADYLETLRVHSILHPDCGAIAGALLQLENGSWVDAYPPKTFRDLLWRFIFQLSVWGELKKIKYPLILKPVFSVVKRFYENRGNGSSLAGWPIIVSREGEYFKTSFYSLGANLVQKKWLLDAPYDEVLDPSGIGDNYGVASGFPGKHPIHVLRKVHAYHHRSKENRLPEATAYYRRILALHYFLKRDKKKSAIPWLIWSLCGSLMIHLFNGDRGKRKAAGKALRVIVHDKNPYWDGYITGRKVVQPQL